MALPNTHIGAEKIGRLLEGKKSLFFAGIGGVSMNALAHVSHLMGHRVSGYDRTPGRATEKLCEMGVTVYYEADASHVDGIDALIYTVAMPEDNPEYAEAKRRGITLISRADYLGYLMTAYKHRIAVSGTHGKSTTTGMIAKILTTASVDPTVLNGAILKDTGTVDIIGGHEYFAFEACEYMDSFLDFNPTVAVVLNIELDHVDYFKSIDQIKESFADFMALTGKDGAAVININDRDCIDAAVGYEGHLVTFAHDNPEADYYSANEIEIDGYPAFDVMHKREKLAHVCLHVPGEHSVSDALAAFAACHYVGIDARDIAYGLDLYGGIGRRMELISHTKAGAAVYSDYGHHPTEIATTLTGARHITKGRLHVVFQPHTFSRLAELFDGFVNSLAHAGADEVVLCPVYAAREVNTYGVTSDNLAEAISARGVNSTVAETFESAAAMVASLAKHGDTIVVMGAGDVEKVAKILEEQY